MAGTKQFITGSVGVGGRNARVDVLALEQLLIAAGTDVIGGAVAAAQGQVIPYR